MTPYHRFKRKCLSLQVALGLGDWRFEFRKAPVKDAERISEVDLDLDQRLARFTWNSRFKPGYEVRDTPEDTASHEVLHVAFFEMLLAAASSHYPGGRRVLSLEHGLVNRLARLI